MEESDLLKEVLGEHIFNNFLHVKRNEWEKYRMQITQWELEKYLPVI